MNDNFMHIEDIALRTWNQCAKFFNLISDEGEVSARKYADKLDKVSKGRMFCMYGLIRERGYEEVERAVHRGGLELGVVH